MIINFGKYKGEEIENLPEDYLYWLSEQDWLKPNLREEVENQLRLKMGQGVIRSKGKYDE